MQSRYVQTCTLKKNHVQWQNVIVDIRFVKKQYGRVRDAEGKAWVDFCSKIKMSIYNSRSEWFILRQE